MNASRYVYLDALEAKLHNYQDQPVLLSRWHEPAQDPANDGDLQVMVEIFLHRTAIAKKHANMMKKRGSSYGWCLLRNQALGGWPYVNSLWIQVSQSTATIH